jgi:hypothetical protein
MNDVDATAVELLLSDPQIVAWLEPDESEEDEDN